MPKFSLDENEVYTWSTAPPNDIDPDIELTDDEVADYERVTNEYQAWQDRLDEALRVATRKRFVAFTEYKVGRTLDNKEDGGW